MRAVWELQAREATLAGVREALAAAHRAAALVLPAQTHLASRAGRKARLVRAPAAQP